MNKDIYTKSKRKKPWKIAILAIALLLLCAMGFVLARLFGPPAEPAVSEAGQAQSTSASLPSSVPSEEQPAAEPEPEPEPEPLVRFSAVGDNLIHNGIYLQAQERAGGSGYDFDYVYEPVSSFFSGFDVNWINQETLVTDELAPSTYPLFSTPGELGRAAYDAGWRVFSLSNNHSYDMGGKGVEATQRYWAAMPEDTVTTGFYPVDDPEAGIAIHEVNGMKIAYLAFTDHTNGLPEPEGISARVIYTSETELMERLVRTAAGMADAVVAGVHWEVENSHETTPAQRSLAQNLADWGATVVIGTHPHVIQGLEWLDATDGRRVPVAYSLGNFLSAQSQANQMIGLCLTFTLRGGEDGVAVEDVLAYPTVTHYDSGYKNIRSYMLADYTDELAASHGVRGRFPNFSVDYIREVVKKYVPAEFIP